MSSSLGAMDFFALEAGEYLERLSTITADPDGPARDEFVRFARALRGSALMANQAEFARAAGGLEAIARSYRDGTMEWDARAREVSAQGIEDLKTLLQNASAWSRQDTQQADRLVRELEQIAGQPAPVTRRRVAEGTGGGINTGVRAFVAREGALIASALERASRSLGANPDDMSPVHNFVRRMQSLRGLAELTDLSPLPEMLESLELAAGALTRMHAPPPDIAGVLRLAAEAMTRASRDVADAGRPDSLAPEAKRFTHALIAAFVSEGDVVDVAALGPADAESVVSRGTAPVPDTHLAGMELVGHGEHLAQMADQLLAVASDVERDLRLFAMIDTLTMLHSRIGSDLGASFRAVTNHIGVCLDTGTTPEKVRDTLGKILREAGEILKRAGGDDSGASPAPTARLGELIGRLEEVEPVAEEAAPAGPGPTVVTESSAGAAPVVPIAELAPDDVPTEETSPVESGGLAGSFATYHLLQSERPTTEPSLDPLVGAEQPLPPPAPAPAPTPPPVAAPQRPVAPAPAPAPTPEDEEAVSIGALLYRGEAARTRARELAREIAECLDLPGALLGLRPLLEELLDLLPLAGEPATDKA